MKNKWMFAILALIMTLPLQSQTVGPLHQVISSNSLINRPMVFRDLQANMKKEFDNVEPGLSLQLLYDKMSMVRKDVLALIQSPQLQYSNDRDSLFINYLDESLGISITLNPEEKIFFDIPKRMAKTLSQRLEHFLAGISKEQRDGILFSLSLSIEGSGIAAPKDFVDSVSAEGKYSERFAANIAFGLVDMAKTPLERELDRDLDTLTVVGLTTSLVNEFNKISKNISVQFRDQVSQAFDIAEHEVANVVDEFSRFLVGANAGLAVTEGPEGFSGGFSLSYVASQYIQLGLYVNGEFSQRQSGGDTLAVSSEDTLSFPDQSLIGLQFRWACDDLQVDLLTSVLFANSGFDMFDTWEFGAAFSYRVSRSLIFGVEAFRLQFFKSTDGFTGDLKNVSTFGISFKGTSLSSPSILLGGTLRDGDSIKSLKPVFQVSFPIVAKGN